MLVPLLCLFVFTAGPEAEPAPRNAAKSAVFDPAAAAKAGQGTAFFKAYAELRSKADPKAAALMAEAVSDRMQRIDPGSLERAVPLAEKFRVAAEKAGEDQYAGCLVVDLEAIDPNDPMAASMSYILCPGEDGKLRVVDVVGPGGSFSASCAQDALQGLKQLFRELKQISDQEGSAFFPEKAGSERINAFGREIGLHYAGSLGLEAAGESKLLAATAEPVNGLRVVLFHDSKLAVLREQVFAELAKKQGFKHLGVKAPALEPALEAEVLRLVAELSSDKPKLRSQARRSLIAKGRQILPRLRQIPPPEDVETREALKEIQEAILPAPKPLPPDNDADFIEL
ncbi:MAG: hypothetical protein RL095_1212 [Verrucomicrobiota bacterium]|jgi:hypothetical protein